MERHLKGAKPGTVAAMESLGAEEMVLGR